ncbi:hypothetical protein O7598_19970 [Micromonospora sp. WMMC241]|uniref:hypothetical protein n=1 Tax=Micromonospora sp. WMMC241 TaxID=3015159 RepID=UPI0022B6EC6D|nr:hypothetical protein [Micromonospora sp. WMMC241]MCZ7438699.1 hypothetical protein [Micromonospora sp. WMMC241]
MDAPARPWWQTTKTPRQGFVMGGAWLFLGVAYWAVALGKPIGWSVILGALATLLGAFLLTTAVLLRRRLRR